MVDVSAVLDVRDVSVQFGGVRACDSVSFDVQPGELFAMIGPNGAGKTTVVNAMGTGMPYSANRALDWYSWRFMLFLPDD